MAKILVRQLGNGGAFDYDQTNTAFTLFDDQILVDCGYNIFPKLMSTTDENGIRLANKIKYILITHKHDDHIGSLMSYLYWIELIRKTPVKVFTSDYCWQLKDSIKTSGIYYYPNIKKPFQYVIIECLPEGDYSFILTPMISIIALTYQTHGPFTNTAYIFDYFYTKHPLTPIRIVITGDTKAYKELEEVAYNEFKERLKGKSGRFIVFHDYFKYPTLAIIHATDIDINAIYSDEFRKYLVYVHTGDKNFKEIYTIDDLKEIRG